MNITPVTLRLLVIQAVVTIVVLFSGQVAPQLATFVHEYLTLEPSDILRGFVWQPVTYLFLHAGAGHLLWNMLFLFFLGPILESSWGPRSFLRFFLISGVGAGVAVILAGLIFPYFDHPTVGMSGALNAMLMAFAIANPNAPMRFMFVLQLTARQLVWVVVLLEVLAAVSGDRTASFPAHMGGLAMGYLLVTGKWRVSRWNLPFFNKKKKTKLSGKAGNLRIVRSDDDDDDERPPKTYLN